MMSVTAETHPARGDEEECSFVSINLESSETCGICGQDTGERLASSCQLCHLSPARQPVQKGFNKMPEVLHRAGAAAHESCLAKAHRAQALAPTPAQARRSWQHSPSLHRRGVSVPGDMAGLGLAQRDGVGDRLQWVVNYARNEDRRNRQNLLQVHSNPCTRPGSPVISPALAEDALWRRHSENSLDTGFLELRRSYSRYLYGSAGGGVPKSRSDDNVGCKLGSCPTISVDGGPGEKTETAVPRVGSGSVRGQIVSPKKNPPQGTKPDSTRGVARGKVPELPDNNNESKRFLGSTSDSLSNPGAEEGGVTQDRSGSQRWCNKQKIDGQQLNSMSVTGIKVVVSRLEELIKDISGELVELLQERDSLGQEVKVRNLTIQKLVKMKHSQQDTPVKMAVAGNI